MKPIQQLYVHSLCPHAMCHVCLTWVHECTQCRQNLREGTFKRLYVHFDVARRVEENPEQPETYYQEIPEDDQAAATAQRMNNVPVSASLRPDVPVLDDSELPNSKFI